MRRLYILSCVLLSLPAQEPDSRRVIIPVKQVLAASAFTAEAEILDYDSNVVRFRALAFSDTINQARCYGACLPRLQQAQSNYNRRWSGTMPDPGDTVLVVISPARYITLFGKKVRDHYRLWYPDLRDNISVFEFEAPLEPVEGMTVHSSKGGTIRAEDGCLLPAAKLRMLEARYKKETQ